MDQKALGEHKEKFETERKRLQIDYQDARKQKLDEIKSKNVELTRHLKTLNPDGGITKRKSVQDDLETIKETLQKIKASPSRQQAAMKDYSEHIKKNHAPKVSQKKKDELERAIVDVNGSQFARQTPHLPLEAMTVNDPNHPLSPQFLKQAIKQHQEYFVKSSAKKGNGQDSEMNDQLIQSKGIDELP